MPWDLSCPDWEDRLREGRSLVPDLPLFKEEADRAVAIFNKLRLPDVPGFPRFESAAGDWFRDIIRALFGSFDVVTAQRMVREIFLLIPKKNSKTTNGAGLMMTATMLNRRPRADFIFVGPTQGTADLAFSQAIGMIEADDEAQRQENGKEGWLKQSMRVQEHLKRIVYYGAKGRPRGKSDDKNFISQLRIKTFSEEILTGPRPAGIMLDEIHELGKDAAAARIILQLRGGMISNPESFMAMFTTQSSEPPAGVFLSELTNARMARSGEVKGDLLQILYEFPDDLIESDKWRDPVNWPMINPNCGRSLTVDRLLAGYEKARITGDAEINSWASQHLNIQIGIALKSNAWKGARHWEINVDPGLTLDTLIERCDVVVVGIDGGGLDDLLGLAVLGREKDSNDDLDKRRWLLWNHAWCDENVLNVRQDIAPRLLDFRKAGDLTIVDNPGDDVFEVADIVEKINHAGLLPEENAIGVDPVGIGEIVDELGARDLAGTDGKKRIVGIPQGWKLNGAIKSTERRLKGRRLVHAGQALMAWCAGNAKIEQRGNAISITKQVSGTAKIDPLMATFNAAALMCLNPAPAESVYERRGFLVM